MDVYCPSDHQVFAERDSLIRLLHSARDISQAFGTNTHTVGAPGINRERSSGASLIFDAFALQALIRPCGL